MATYPIVEIFHSVQGEAFHSGVPHVFIRFGNCNLRCEWCDTNFLEYEEMELDDIIDEVLKYNCKRVIFTGGEPCLQDLKTIGSELKKYGINLSVETNGTIEVPELIDWICVSPKDQVYPNSKIIQRTGDELKVVYCGQNLSMYDDLKQGFTHHFIQPCYIEAESIEQNGANFAVVENLVKENPGWRLSLQTHKWMGVD
ncbi:MAG: 7-carboxy-7-deazaguanine synthase [Euryarchaeota archaeon]|nr:7-carboxy-7-deazaguanine synthase [Euryarchaeota archaeon]|tara:strand:- start:4214 stop:4810 length:597 start_codon:yes stop_codon:yes gene_type:complete